MAPDGPSAIEHAMTFQPDAVLLDIGLPGINGYQVAQQLRSQLGLSTVLIIAISGYGQVEDCERSRAAGINHHFTKPIDLHSLQDLLANYSRKRVGKAAEG